MGLAAGKLRFIAVPLVNTEGQDEWGAPAHQWVDGPERFRVGLKAPSGLSGARNAMAAGVPYTANFYSLLMRAADASRLAAYRRLRVQMPQGLTMVVEVQGVPSINSDAPDTVTLTCKQVTPDGH